MMDGFDPFKSCHGCPPTRRHPGCHDTCLGKSYRKAIKELERKQVQLRQAAYSKPSDAEFERRNLPTQKSMNLGLMEIKERTINNPDGTVRLTMTPKVTGKGQVYFVNRYKDWRE